MIFLRQTEVESGWLTVKVSWRASGKQVIIILPDSKTQK